MASQPQQEGGIQLGDPITMELSPQELQRAHVIKDAVEADENLKNMTDFEYVQFSLVHPVTVPVETVLNQIGRLQAFREEYGILDLVEDGLVAVALMNVMYQDHILSVHYMPSHGNCAMISDMARFYPRNIEVFLKGMYYYFNCMNPTFYSMRCGISMLTECEGVTWSNFNQDFAQTAQHQLSLSYPKNHKEVYLLNTPTIPNIIYGLWKRCMSPNLKAAIHMGYQVPGMEGIRLDRVYNLPTPEIARQRLLQEVRHLLQVRYHNQATYKLPSPPV